MKAAVMALIGKSIPVDYVEPDIRDEITVIFPLWAGTMPPGIKTFTEIDLVGKDIAVPDTLD